MPESWNVSYAAMAVMALVGLFTVVFPLGLGLVFWRKFGGRWRFFLLGCVIFPLFALTLEGGVNRAVLYGPIGDTITGNLWLYALFGGAMAGIFEECGRWAAFRLTRRWSRGPEDALMYGAGHGGIEAALLAGSMMLNNLLVSMALNQDGLAGVEALMGTGPCPTLRSRPWSPWSPPRRGCICGAALSGWWPSPSTCPCRCWCTRRCGTGRGKGLCWPSCSTQGWTPVPF